MKILVIDASAVACRAMIKLLYEQLEGCQIIDTSYGNAAVDLFRDHNYEITFLDLTTPEICGEKIIENIPGFDSDSKSIVVSADIQQKTKETVNALGATCMVNKPITPDKLAQVITSIF